LQYEDKINEVYLVLQKLVGFHKQLLELVRLERTALESANLKNIEEVTYSKEVLIHSIKQAELERVRSVANLAAQMEVHIADLSLSNLVLALQQKELQNSEKFRSVQNTLKVLIEHIVEQNQANQKLVNASLKHVQEMKINALGENQNQSQTYTAKGQKNNQTTASRLVSQEA